MSLIIVGIIILVIVFHQNSRISKLEALMKGMTKAQPNPSNPGVNQESGKVQVAGNPDIPITPPVAGYQNTPINTPAPTAYPSPAAQVPTIKPKEVSSEEASGRILGRIGIAAVVIGVGFFLRYAFANNWIGPAGRVVLGILIGVVVILLGQYLRKKYLGYSDLLMGGGLAILYLSVFASFALYHLVDPMMAFFGMVVVTAIGVILSITNATQTLAFVAFAGGFLAPVLIGVTEIGTWITFTYITILNAGVLGIALSKKWNNLVLFALIGTWLIFGMWFAMSYTKDLLIPTLLFVLIQYLILTGSSVIRIIVEKAKAEQLDYFVLTTTALSFAWVCYYLLMPEYKHFVSLGAVLVAGFYVVIALIAYKENPEDRTLNIFLPGLAVAFLTVAVPIEFSGEWIAAWWFVEAIVLYIVASSSSSRGFQIMGVIVYMLGLFDLLVYIFGYSQPVGYVIFFNGPFIMLMMAAVTAYVITFVYYRYGSVSAEIQRRGVAVFVVIANILTLYALTTQVISYYELQQVVGGYNRTLVNASNTSVSILWALYAALLTIIGFAKRYATPRRMGLVLFIITAFKVVVNVWSLGELYRVVSFIIFGIIALAASFLYVRYKDRLKDVV